MARTPNTITTQPTESGFNEDRLQEAGEAARQLTVLQANYSEGRDLANQLLGQIQMSRAISIFTDVVSLSKLKQIKENKLYRGAAGQKAVDRNGEEIPDVGTWTGFCRALGVSASKVDEDLANLDTFGEEALNQLNSVGLGYRDLRKFRRLGDDEKTLLIEAAKSGDKDELLELAETLIAKHTKEKEALTATVDGLKADKDASEKMLKSKDEKINKLDRQAKKFNVDTDLPEAFLEGKRKVGDAVNGILTHLNQLELLRDQALNTMRPPDEHGQAVHKGELENLGRVMQAGYLAISAKLANVSQTFADTLEQHLQD